MRICKILENFGRGFVRLSERICETLGEDLQGSMRIWVRIHEDLQGFMRLWETLVERLWVRIHEDSQDFG